MQEQIEKLRELAEYALAVNNVYAVHEMIEKMLVIIGETSTDKASSKQEDVYLCSLSAENALPEAP